MTLPDCLVLNRLQISLRTLLQLLERLEHHNPGSLQHARGVARYTRLLTRQIDLPKDLAFNFYIAGMLHDIGKLCVPADLINKPGPLLNTGEFEMVQAHAVYGRAILSVLPELFPILDGVYLHHERWDGSGYPLGLRGRQIPLMARVIAIVDVYYAMIQPRSYREAISMTDVVKHLWAESGRHFDPVLVLAFTQVLGDKMPLNREQVGNAR